MILVVLLVVESDTGSVIGGISSSNGYWVRKGKVLGIVNSFKKKGIVVEISKDDSFNVEENRNR